MPKLEDRITKEQKVRWIEALRSGRYKQGHGEMHNPDDNEYCCLGVLAEVCNIKSCSDNYLKTNDDFLLLESSEQYNLADKNDEGWNFSKIASYIERAVKVFK